MFLLFIFFSCFYSGEIKSTILGLMIAFQESRYQQRKFVVQYQVSSVFRYFLCIIFVELNMFQEVAEIMFSDITNNRQPIINIATGAEAGWWVVSVSPWAHTGHRDTSAGYHYKLCFKCLLCGHWTGTMAQLTIHLPSQSPGNSDTHPYDQSL